MAFGRDTAKEGWRWALILLHVLLWGAFALQAYRTASTDKYASCWGLILLYFPPLNMLFWAIATPASPWWWQRFFVRQYVDIRSFGQPAMA